jgi:hypothetical protein
MAQDLQQRLRSWSVPATCTRPFLHDALQSAAVSTQHKHIAASRDQDCIQACSWLCSLQHSLGANMLSAQPDDVVSLCVSCAGGGGRSGPPAAQRRRDTLPDDITELTELKKHEKVRSILLSIGLLLEPTCLGYIILQHCWACAQQLEVLQGRNQR